MEMQVANSSILKAHQDTSGISGAFKMGKQCSCSITSSAGRQHQLSLLPPAQPAALQHTASWERLGASRVQRACASWVLQSGCQKTPVEMQPKPEQTVMWHPGLTVLWSSGLCGICLWSPNKSCGEIKPHGILKKSV